MKITPAVIARARPLLDFIARFESRGNYSIVWGGIRKQHQPPRDLTTMTIGEVLAWQDSIDPLYMSEASGKYQIMEDTLRGLYKQAGMSTSDLFDKAGQDRLATALLIRRGYDDYLDGKIGPEKFANSLAKEWASLPVVTGPKKGRSHYGGDGLNKAHASVEETLAAVRAARETPEPAIVREQPSQTPGFLASIFSLLAKMLGGGRA